MASENNELKFETQGQFDATDEIIFEFEEEINKEVIFELEEKINKEDEVNREAEVMAKKQKLDSDTDVHTRKRRLYASRSWLCMASPVFEAMFEHKDTSEAQTRTVKITDFKIEHFKEFLLCLHPRILKRVTESNALQIAGLADKYLHEAMKKECESTMIMMVNKPVQENSYYIPSGVKKILEVLVVAAKIQSTSVIDEAVDQLSRYNAHLYSNNPTSRPIVRNCYYGGSNQDYEQYIKLYSSLPTEVRLQIALKRQWRLETDKYNEIKK